MSSEDGYKDAIDKVSGVIEFVEGDFSEWHALQTKESRQALLRALQALYKAQGQIHVAWKGRDRFIPV